MSADERYKALVRAYHPDVVGKRIRRLRLHWELNQSEMARLLEVRPNTISQFESGYSRPASDIETRIKALFQVTLDWIRYGETTGLPTNLALKLDDASDDDDAGKQLAPDYRVVGKKLSRPARRGPKKTS